MTRPKGDTLSLSEPTIEREVRTAPHLFLEVECDRPLAGPARWRLRGLEQVRLGRGASRRSQTAGRMLTIEVPDGRMSVEHLELMHREGRWVARDLGSKNKLILDGQPVDEVEMSDGALLQLGHTLLRFRSEVPAVDPATLDLEHVSGGIGPLTTLSPAFRLVLDRAAAVASGRVPVLLVGESGTGKEVLARSIHAQSGRKGALVAVNCGAIPANLVDAELFGHKKGAFTGAAQERVGWVRASDHSTLFLDEIGDLPLTAQASLLRVIEEAEVVPVGGNRPEALDLRVVAATQRDLKALVREGRFRHDLLARLDGITLQLPALRDRSEDIPVLLVLLLRRLAPERPDVRFTPAAAQAILTHDWPLNIRQLEQALVGALALSGNGPIERAHLPEAVVKGMEPQPIPEPDPEESRHREELLRRTHPDDRFAVASIAHEVKQPLSAVVMNAGASLRWLAHEPPDLAEARAGLERIVEAGRRAGDIVGRVRDLASKSPPQKEPLDLNETILGVIKMACGEAENQHVSIETRLATHLPTVWADRVQVQQVLLNLIKNALESMSHSAGPRELSIASRIAETCWVVIEVKDTGRGLDPATAEHMFDPFYTTKPQGAGIGLTISRSMIEAHGGKLWAIPNSPRGAIFVFSLPAPS